MKYIITTLLIAYASSAIAQQHFSRGNATSIDSNRGTAVARYTMLQLDTAKSTVWSSNGGAANITGNLWLWNGTKWVSPTSGVNQSILDDSCAAIRADITGGSTDSTIFTTIYRDDTGKAAIRGEIPYYADSIARAYDSLAAHNTRLITMWNRIDTTSANLYAWAWATFLTSFTETDPLSFHKVDSNTAANAITYSYFWTNIPTTSGFVPYTGATTNVDLGAYNLKTDRLNSDTLEPNTSAGLHIHNTSHQDILIAGAGGGQTMTIYAATNLDQVKIQNSTDTVLTTNSSGTIGKAALASVYLKIATAASTYVAATTTSVNTVPITSGINNTVTASASTLTTTTLNPTVVTSSLTSVGNITAGTWSSTIGSAATGSTQAINNNSAQIATTAYVDRYFPADTTISAAYTLTSRDFHRTIHCTNGSNIALTIPTGLGTTFECVVLAEGAGTVTPTTSSTTFYYQPTSTTKIKSQGGATIRSWATANSYLIIGSLE